MPKHANDSDDEKEKRRIEMSKRRRRERKSNVSDTDDDEEYQPTHERLTARGGYSHTDKSKERISKANKGNTPWNKGRHRSSADRAKIAAGVRARNREILLKKLKKLGMTEEEWYKKKKEIKYLRERVRRAKLAKMNRKAAAEEAKLKAVLAATTLAEEEKEKEEEEKKLMKGDPDEVQKEAAAVAFARAVVWEPHELDAGDYPYELTCPVGGPGGLICCKSCVQAYSNYLTKTSTDLEVQRMHNAGSEVKEITDFLQETRTRMNQGIRMARRRVPPVSAATSEPSNATPGVTSAVPRKAVTSKQPILADWDMTSTLDIENIETEKV